MAHVVPAEPDRRRRRRLTKHPPARRGTGTRAAADRVRGHRDRAAGRVPVLQARRGDHGGRDLMSMIDVRFDAVSKRYRLDTSARGTGSASRDFWAVRDVSFDVQHGETLGLIGHNGAGKSTILKLLSRITAPTEGTITLNGRVAALIEVGSGFHPELSG